jgi:hypothetical protein
VLSDDEARLIAEARRAGVAEPRRLARWVDVLLAERRELRSQLDVIQRRLGQAFRYFDRLCVEKAHVDWIRSRLREGATYLDGLFVRRGSGRRSPLDDRH